MQKSAVVFALVFCTYFFFSADKASAQEDVCLKFKNSAGVPAGYGAAVDVLAIGNPLLVKSDCPDSGNDLTVTIGRGYAVQFVWKTTYVYTGTSWVPYVMSGIEGENGWLYGQGQKVVPIPFAATKGNPVFFVGYVCQAVGTQWKCGCVNASCKNSHWQLQAYTGEHEVVSGGVVRHFAPRTITLPPNKTGESGGGGLIDNIAIPPADEYYLDYTITFGPFDWETRKQSGKIPGLAGGVGTGGCRAESPDGWSARQTFAEFGKMTVYLYFQDRDNGCGVKFTWKNPDGSQFAFEKNHTYRVTQYVKVNTPNQPDGIDRIWIDGTQVFDKTDIVWRGVVAPSVARVSQLKYHVYFGGKSFDDTPSYESRVTIGDLYIMSCKPNFSKAPGSC